MKKLYLCTVGTSISNGCNSQKEFFSNQNKNDRDSKKLISEIQSRILNMNIRDISAECNSLDRSIISTEDKIVLLVSDNVIGQICAIELKNTLCSNYNLDSNQIIIEKIDDLQVYDEKKLRNYGLKNFIKTVMKYLSDTQLQNEYETIINPTGGFKGVIPFLSILGMLYGKKIIYIFEFSEELITLPPLPFSYDIELFKRVVPALNLIENEIAITQDQFLNQIIGYTDEEKDIFLSFTEPFDNNLITMSPLAHILLEIKEKKQTCLINDNVQETIENLKGSQKVIIQRMIEYTSDPIWRSSHIHTWGKSTDLLVIKRARTPERLAGFVKDNIFHVVFATPDHDEYESKLGKLSIKDFENDTFTEFINEDELGTETTEINFISKERDDFISKYNTLNKTFKHSKQKFEEDSLEKDLKIEEFEKSLNEKINLLDKVTNEYSAIIKSHDYLKKELKIANDKIHKFENLTFIQKLFNLLK